MLTGPQKQHIEEFNKALAWTDSDHAQTPEANPSAYARQNRTLDLGAPSQQPHTYKIRNLNQPDEVDRIEQERQAKLRQHVEMV